MSYKISLVLSMIFISLFFLFGVDLLCLQSAYSALDAKANNISYLISRNGVINQEFIEEIESTFHVEFICDEYPAPTFGQKITYIITSKFHPMVIDKNEMTIAVQRMTIIGFYG
ncbi:MAG TPA: hypothetical protein GX010_03895 [Erysipelotrichaceae bacterium]|nr:hypothetical protein [Erysipelotrichaceae bacterium]